MMDLVEQMVEKIALDLHQKTNLKVGDKEIDFKTPWQRKTMYDVILEFTNIDISNMNENELIEVAKKLNITIDKSMGKRKNY